MPCCVVLPTDIGVVEVSHEDQGLWMWGCSYLSIEGFICSVFLVRWPVADLYHNVTSPWPAFNPDPSALSWLFTHPQEELHALQPVIDIKGDIPSLSPLSVLPKEPVSFHSKTPVTGAIPPRLCDANEIIALQVGAGHVYSPCCMYLHRGISAGPLMKLICWLEFLRAALQVLSCWLVILLQALGIYCWH